MNRCAYIWQQDLSFIFNGRLGLFITATTTTKAAITTTVTSLS